MAWQGATWPPAATATAKQTGVTEVVLRGVTREADGRNREVVLFTDRATGRQTVRMRFQTNGEELSACNEGLTMLAAQRQGGAVGRGEQSSKAGLAKEPEKPKKPERKDEAE